ncbi:MAG: IS21 family transposase, partial [Acidimicrobiales bacterium]
VLRCKPGALPGATALAQARAAGAFTPAHDAYWSLARRRRGDRDGTRALIEVLLAHRSLPAEAVVEALVAAVQAEIVDPAVVIVEARRRAEGQVAGVVPIGALRHYDRPLPVLGGYDELLGQAQ